MLASGQFVVPVLNHSPYYDKPPLLYWLVMGSYAVLGVHDWAARLVSSGAGFLTVLVTYFWGKRVAGPRAALLGALMLCLSPRFVYLSRLVTMNGLLCLCVTAALAAAHAAVCGPALRRGWWLLSALTCGLGCLAKGPVALALVIVPVLASTLLKRPAFRLGPFAWVLYILTTLVPAGPWFVALALRDPEFLGYFFRKHHVLRFVEPFDHDKPVWFYLPDLLLGMLPWSLLLLPLLSHLVARVCIVVAWSPDRATTRARKCERLNESGPAPVVGFFLLAALWCLVFFSAAGSKRSGYILPAMPPLALALGSYLDLRLTAAKERRIGGAWGVCAVLVFAGLFVAVEWLLPGYARRFSMRGQVRPLAARHSDIPVICYPRCWDSVSFYLQRDDVSVYTQGQRRQLMSNLQQHARSLAFIKSEESLHHFLQALPASLEFVPQGRQGGIAVGWIQRRRPQAAESLILPH
jgi:4-amino-4-deoxy-L-arabinose transferase-like glycosyltransferase